jgi:protein-disulfide isomerase
LKHPAVTDADIQAFYEQHKAQINEPLDAVRARITQVLEKQRAQSARQAYVDSLRDKYAAHVTLEPRRQNVTASGPTRGPKDASVTIVEFADFQCPYCGKMEPVLRQILEHYPKDVRLVYRHLPLSDLHPNALQAATASVCAQEQGRFWEMHDAMFADQGALGADALSKTADKLHLKKTDFQACMAGHEAADVVKADAQAATDAFVDGTPGLFINGRYFSGAISYERLAAVVNDELSRRGRPVPSS